MKSIAILLTDYQSINERIILNSLKKLKFVKLKKIYLIGDKNYFPKIYHKIKKIDKFIFIDVACDKSNFIYLKKTSDIAINLFKNKKIKFLINMPLNKKKFFNKNYPGYTEFFSSRFQNKSNGSMLLFNKKFSVSPVTTHIELKKVNNAITTKNLKKNINDIINFYKKFLKKRNFKVVVLGLNPHASADSHIKNKDQKILKPVVNFFKNKKIDITGPISADTAFKNLKNKIFVGMYHDQVLIPFKLINNFNGVNITIGKELIRLSPDHGTAENLKNKKRPINNTSFLECIKFCEKYA